MPNILGVAPAKKPAHILGGLLTFQANGVRRSDSLIGAFESSNPEGRLDIGCVAAHGMFRLEDDNKYSMTPERKPATAFLLELIALLQGSAKVPMIDVRAYAKWLTD